MTEFIDTTDQLFALPMATAVRSRAGLIASRSGLDSGLTFGNEAPIRWRSVSLPAAVLWRPDRPGPSWDPPPPPEIDTFEELLDLPAGCAIRTKFVHPDGHRVYEKFPDGRWKAAGSGRPTAVDRLETMLPGRLVWHPEWR